MLINRKHQAIALFSLLIILLTSCRDRQQGVPNVAVDKEVNITLPGYSSIAIIGGWTYISGGSKGILIYRKTQEEFMAYDRHATFDIDMACAVTVDSSNNIEVLDPCSDTKYSIYDGLVTYGNASLPLKRYNTYFDGTILRIYN